MNRKALVSGFLVLGAGLLAEGPRAQPTTALVSWKGTPGGWQFGSGNAGIGESVFLSANGRYAAFVTDAHNVFDDQNTPKEMPVIAVRDLQTGSVTIATVPWTGGIPNGPSFAPTVTSDGRYVCFCSWADNLVADDNNNHGDVFIRDMQAGTTRRVNVPYDGVWDQYDKTYCVTNAMSDDGRYVVFTTASNHMVPNDTNNSDDVFLRDTVTNQTTLISVASGGGPGNESSIEPRIARNGRYVVFMSFATNLVANTSTPALRTYLRDTDPAHLATTLVADGGVPIISAGGRYVAYASISMTGDDSQVFRYDATTGQRVLCSLNAAGTQGNRDSMPHGISDDGRYVCFTSKARNLVSDDTNDEADVFLRDLGAAPATTTRVSVAKDGLQGRRASGNASMSADGRYIAFASYSEDLVSLDLNEKPDVFLRGPMSGQAFQLSDAMNALRISAGGQTRTTAGGTLDVVQSGTSGGRVDLLDAVRITRSIVGLD